MTYFNEFGQARLGWRTGGGGITPSTLWNSIYSVYNADSVGSSSLKTSLYAAYNGESNANDSFGSNNGTAQGGLTYTAGKIGNAFNFNGTNAYVRLPRTSNQFDFTGDFSISLWFNQSVGGNLFNNSYQTSTTNRFGYNLYLQGGRLRFATYKGNTSPLSASNIGQATATPINTNTWYHVVVTKTTSNAFKMYINGVLQSLGVIDGDLSLNPVYSSSNTVNIGAEQGISGFLNGKIDALNIWQKELTQSEITELYNSGNGSQYITDNFYKPTTNDALNTYNGTAQGGLTYGVGKVGTAFQFNGTTSYVSFPAGSFNSLTTDFSVSAWVYLPSSYNSTNHCPIFSNMSAPGWFETPGGFWVRFVGTTIQFGIGGKMNPTFLNYDISNDNLLGTWIHVVAVRKNNTSNKIYINNVLKASYTDTNPATLVNPVYYTGVNLTTPTIGNVKMPNGVQDGYYAYNGSKIDALNVWNKELSVTEITELYNSGNGKQYPN